GRRELKLDREESSHGLLGLRRRAVHSAQLHNVPFQARRCADLRLAQLARTLGDGLEYRLHIIRRGADDAKHFTCRILPLVRLRELLLEFLHLPTKVTLYTSGRRIGRHDGRQPSELSAKKIDDGHGTCCAGRQTKRGFCQSYAMLPASTTLAS